MLFLEWLSNSIWLVGFALVIVILVGAIIYIAQIEWDKPTKPLPIGPVFIENPHPDRSLFLLGQIQGAGSDSCLTGHFTIKRVGPDSLLYDITLPTSTTITDIYVLESVCESDFPLAADGCAVDLSTFHHENFPCTSSTNHQTIVTKLATPVLCHNHMLISMIVAYSTDLTTCSTVQMMTITNRGAKSITMREDCIVPPCEPNQCCDPIIPNFIRVKLPHTQFTPPQE